jgi:hypothetical protein
MSNPFQNSALNGVGAQQSNTEATANQELANTDEANQFAADVSMKQKWQQTLEQITQNNH